MIQRSLRGCNTIFKGKIQRREGGSLEGSKSIDEDTWNQKQKKSYLCTSPVVSPNVLSDKSTQSESSQISLVQVDLEQIKYKIQSTFLNQTKMQAHR